MKSTAASDTAILRRHKKIWKEKPLLQQLYALWYKKIISDLSPTNKLVVELGAGTGNFKDYYPKSIASDIVPCPWLDKCFDAHHMPFSDKSVSSLVLIDVLHHLEDPIQFLHEAKRVLLKGGRIILLEPYPSLFSLPFYRAFHAEPFIFDQELFLQKKGKVKKKAWDSNQAIPYILFFKEKKKFEQLFAKNLRIRKREYLSFFVYPLSGGFEHSSKIPSFLLPFGFFIERLLSPVAFLFAFRCYIVIERL